MRSHARRQNPMTPTKPAAFAVLASAFLSAAPVAAQPAAQPGLAALQEAFAQARALRPSADLRAQAAAETAAQATIQSLADSLFKIADMAGFPAPDAATLAFLRSRIPDLPAASVRAVPTDVILGALSAAAARGVTFLDLLTDPALRGGDVYYASAESLQTAADKYVIGLLPPSGVAKDRRPFKMLAAVGGQGKLTFLYDRTDEFQFDEGGRTFKVKGGRVSAVITGPGALDQMQGLAVHGCVGPFCKWADFIKWQKEGAYKVHVWVRVGGGVRDQVNDLTRIHPK